MTVSLPPPLVEQLGTPVAWADAEGRITGCNPAFARWLGVSGRRLVGQPLVPLALQQRLERSFRLLGLQGLLGMLVSTLACEWGSRALRINALVVPADVTPLSLHPLLRYVCGASAQFLTGQTIACRRPSLGAAT